jgi:hypothetical protein
VERSSRVTIRDLTARAGVCVETASKGISQRSEMIGKLVADLESFSATRFKGAAGAIRRSGFEIAGYSAGGHASDHADWKRPG